MKMITYGSRAVPVISRVWPTTERKPYRKTYCLKPGELWSQAEETTKQWESYVATNDNFYEPVGALVARELIEEGAALAGFFEMWGGIVFVDQNLICQPIEGEIASIIDQVREANGGRLAGFPDAIGIFSDGTIAMREIKNLDTKDRLSKKQHELADLMFNIFNKRLDLRVVEWTSTEESKKGGEQGKGGAGKEAV